MKGLHAILLLIIPLGLMVLVSCRPETESVSGASVVEERGNTPLSVETVPLEYGKLIDRVTGSGVIRGRREGWSIARTEGTITEVFVSPGDYVRTGDPLLKVDDSLAYWEMKRAEQQFKTADFEYRGIKDSFEKGALSELEYNRASSAWYSSRSAFEQATKAYEECTLRAPLSGYVSQMDTTLTAGNLLTRGTVLLKVINTEEFLLTLSLGQREVGMVHPGSEADIFIELAEGTLQSKGEVLDISAGSDGDLGSFPLRVHWPNEWNGRVKPGMTARVEIRTDRAEESLIIPYGSMVERQEKLWVFLAVEENGSYRAEAREVTPGNRLGSRIEIEEGLEEGDILITSALTALYPGANLSLSFREGEE
ncbi:MAG: efflux RND transporter periplasmic adaptor subunit [Spirochaetales bacterium]|nr:efflux RND transporter periplasmic adaptor subunit [Spirochaetales bacterium]